MMNYSRLLLFVGFMLFMWACSSTTNITKVNTSAIDSSLNTDQKLEQLIDTSAFELVSGKAKVLYTSKGKSERFTVEFDANALQTLMRFKNSLGIEGVHIFLDKDSLIEYNKIDKTVQITSRNDFAMVSSTGYTPFPIMDVLIPARMMISEKNQLIESETAYLIENEELLLRASIPKTGRTIQQIESMADIGSFKKMNFSDYAVIEGKQVPRKIQVVGFETSSYSLLILITELRVKSKSKVLKIMYPKTISVERL